MVGLGVAVAVRTGSVDGVVVGIGVGVGVGVGVGNGVGVGVGVGPGTVVAIGIDGDVAVGLELGLGSGVAVERLDTFWKLGAAVTGAQVGIAEIGRVGSVGSGEGVSATGLTVGEDWQPARTRLTNTSNSNSLTDFVSTPWG